MDDRDSAYKPIGVFWGFMMIAWAAVLFLWIWTALIAESLWLLLKYGYDYLRKV